jgi:hypothetical protein
LPAGAPTTGGPFFRIAFKTGPTNRNDEKRGHYFEGTTGPKSTPLTRTMLIPVSPGITYDFGAYYGTPDANWRGKTAWFNVSYVCFRTS